MKYMIHTCNQRRWYVDKYLVPSMLEQGIKEDDIYVYQDTECKGNLKAYMDSCQKLVDKYGEDENVWHLQDDVIICSDFKEKTEALNDSGLKLICAFTCKYDDDRGPGLNYAINHMWYSFPCLMIHSSITKKFVDWVNIYVWRDPQFGFWVRQNKGDDFIFRVFVESYYPTEKCLNLVPNLIDHVDYLLGGTIVNPQREKGGFDTRSPYFEEKELVIKLQEAIANDIHSK